MSIADNLLYSKDHEWVSVDGDIATLGISDHAQEQLGDVVYVELPDEGDDVTKGETFGSVESTKAVSDVYAPISGSVVEINDDLPDNPEVINQDPYGDGWMIRVKMSDKSDLDDLMNAEAYAKFLEDEAE